MIYSVQYLRGVAALLVVLHHIGLKERQYNIGWSWLHIGYTGVDLFFIISGFIMCYTTDGKSIPFGKFLGARITRILPMYWLVTILALFIFIIKPELVNTSGGKTSIWASFTLIPNGDKYLINNGWTLSFEFFYYIIFTCVLFFTNTYKIQFISVLICLLAIIGLLMHPENIYFNFMTNPVLLEFMLGMIAFHIIKHRLCPNAMAYLSITIGASVLVYQNQHGLIFDTPLGRVISAGIPFFMIFIGTVTLEDYFTSNKNVFFKSIEELGNSSYSLYLVHPFLLSLGTIIAKYLGLTKIPFLFTTLLLSSSIIAGWLSYKMIELPLNRFIRNSIKR